MYLDTITIFNKYENRDGVHWFPTVIENVNLNIDRASIVKNYGTDSTDNAVLNVKYSKIGNKKIIDGKMYLPPKEWANQVNDELPNTITFAFGDFFVLGEFPDQVNDDDYIDGFYNYMNSKYDHVFLVTSVAEFSVIPHFEILGK